MSKITSATAYIEKHPEWEQALDALRSLALESGMEETIKWGSPVYTFAGKNLLGIGAFKSYVGYWFFQGALLKDAAGRLVNAQEGKTKAMRQWRFSGLDDVLENRKLILAYLAEAIAHQKAGKEIKPVLHSAIEIPEILSSAFEASAELQLAFESLSLGKRRDYAAYLLEAKRETTRHARLEKIKPMILQGIGLNDKYVK